MRQDCHASIIIRIHRDDINHLPRFVKELRFHADIFPANVAAVGQSSDTVFHRLLLEMRWLNWELTTLISLR